MKLSELFRNDALHLSFEVFPPKTDTAFASVKAAVEEIAELHPSFMSVTYGAGGGTSQYTLDIAKNIKEQHGVPTLAHLTCVSSTKETVREKIAQIKPIMKKLEDREGTLHLENYSDGNETITFAIDEFPEEK